MKLNRKPLNLFAFSPEKNSFAPHFICKTNRNSPSNRVQIEFVQKRYLTFWDLYGASRDMKTNWNWEFITRKRKESRYVRKRMKKTQVNNTFVRREEKRLKKPISHKQHGKGKKKFYNESVAKDGCKACGCLKRNQQYLTFCQLIFTHHFCFWRTQGSGFTSCFWNIEHAERINDVFEGAFFGNF